MRRTFNILIVILVITGLLAFPGCPARDSAGKELEKNRDKWQAQQIADYQFTLRVICFCPEDITSPVIIEVRDGTFSSIRYAQDPDAVSTDFFGRANTVEKLFIIIEEAIEDEADELTVDYDPDYGLPLKIAIDPVFNAVDEEITYTVSDFKIL